MLTKLFETIQKSGRTEQIKIGEREYTTRDLVPVKLPEPAPLSISTLTGLVDFYEKCEADLGTEDSIIAIEAPDRVRLLSQLQGEFQQRMCYVVAKTECKPFPFGQYQGVDMFLVGLQSLFAQDEATKNLLRILGNLQDGMVATFGDDGVSQKVTTKSGVVRVGEEPVPNPVDLAPFRTFPEIVQPASKFILRMRSGEKEPTVALFEADGGAWRNEAISRIKEWIAGKLPEAVILA